MTLDLFRVFDWDGASKGRNPGGPFYVPRAQQGPGRFDIPHLDGVLYASTEKLAAVVEAIQGFRGGRLTDRHFERSHGRRQTLAHFSTETLKLVDLDDPTVLKGRHLRPSGVMTHTRSITRPIAESIFHDGADGMIWPSAFEASWKNIALFESRSAKKLRLAESLQPLTLIFRPLIDAAEWLNIPLTPPRRRRKKQS